MTELTNSWKESNNELPPENTKIQFITEQNLIFVGYFDNESKRFIDSMNRFFWDFKKIKTWRYYN
jgi:hypothetical protein